MSLATSPQLNHQQISGSRFWLERLPYTALDTALPVNTEEIFSVVNLKKDTGNGKQMALITGVTATPTANVSLELATDRDSASWPTAVFTADVPIAADDNRAFRALNKMSLKWVNNTGATLTTPMQTNYYGTMKTLTTADKLLYGVTDLTAQDKQLIAEFGLTDNLYPRPLHVGLDNIFRHAIVQNVEEMVSVNVTATPSTWTILVPSDQIYIWHTLGAEIPAGSVGHYLNWTVTRDDQVNRAAFYLDNTLGLANPWKPWMVATEQISFGLSAVTATNNVLVRWGYYKVKKTRIIQALLGLIPAEDLSTLETKWYHQLLAGILI